MNELRHAVRTLFKRPGFTLVAILTLALGIGANTAIFSIVYGVLLRPLPFNEPDSIVQLKERNSRGGASHVSHLNFLDWRQQSTSFDGMAEYGCETASVLGGTGPRFAQACNVSNGFFHVIGVAPLIGRTFASEELQKNGAPAVIVGHRFWQTTLGSNPDLSSIAITIVGKRARVVGVMPDGFDFPEQSEIWIPSEIDPDTGGRTSHNWTVVARLKPGVPLASASAEMDTIGRQLKQQVRQRRERGRRRHGAAEGRDRAARLEKRAHPAARDRRARAPHRVRQRGDHAAREGRRAADGNGRPRGAGRGTRAPRPAAARRELSVLGILGASAGLLLAAWLMRILRTLNGLALPRHDTIGVDATVLAFTLGLALVTPLVFGLVPSLQASRADLRDALSEGGRSAAPARAGVRTILVIGEVAIALVLLVGSALLMRSFARVMSVDPGFDPNGVVTADMAIPLDELTRSPSRPRSSTPG